MKKKVAFICVHNSCRSQMAEALGKLYGSDVFESYSAGTETKPLINQDAVRIIKDLYNIDSNDVDIEIATPAMKKLGIPNRCRIYEIPSAV